MNTLLMHPYEYLRIHFHPLGSSAQERLEAKPLRKILDFAEQAAMFAFVITMAYIAFFCFVKLVEAEALSSYYCDFCAVMSVMLVAP